jgi:hypothetical protein
VLFDPSEQAPLTAEADARNSRPPTRLALPMKPSLSRGIRYSAPGAKTLRPKRPSVNEKFFRARYFAFGVSLKAANRLAGCEATLATRLVKLRLFYSRPQTGPACPIRIVGDRPPGARARRVACP